MKNKTLLILVAVMVGAVLLTVLFNTAKQEDYKNWQQAEGEVTQTIQGRHFRIRVYYDYTVDGELLSSWESLHIRRDDVPNIGESVSVWYDAEDTARTSLSKPEVTAFDCIAPVFLVIPLSIAVIFADRRNNNR